MMWLKVNVKLLWRMGVRMKGNGKQVTHMALGRACIQREEPTKGILSKVGGMDGVS